VTDMKFKRVPCIGEGVSGLNSEFFEKNWIINEIGKEDTKYDVEVPGNVRLALMAAKVIPDPFIADQNKKSLWVSNVKWCYSNVLNLTRLSSVVKKQFKNGGIIHTVFDAIDYDADFYINNQKITNQIGMFNPIDLSTGITSDSESQVENIPIKINFKIQPFWRPHALKSQMAFGWDFAPEIRTIGIWKNVRQYCTGAIFFTDAYVIAEQIDSQNDSTDNVNNSNQSQKMRIKFRFTVSIKDPKSLQKITDKQQIKLHAEYCGTKKSLEVNVKSGVANEVDFGEADIKLWYPWSLGDPHIEPIKISLESNSEINDEFRSTIINRKIEWIRNPGTFPGNENWTLKVNGQKMFLRGINWVPPDSIYGRISKERYQKLIDAAKDMNVDMLRVWGGGIEEKPEFYDYCDEVGMMVWQEFPFACTNFPDFPEYLKIADKECMGIVQRTRRHPSLVVYCGGNEFNPYINSHIVDIVKKSVKHYAADRHCLAVSPYLGDDHNWRVWGYRRKYDAYDINGSAPYQMLTEYGMQAAPNIETLNQVVSAEKIDPKTTSLESIRKNIEFHRGDVNGHIEYAEKYGRKIETAEDLIKTSQELQAYALKYATEACRAGWPNISGIFPWQLSDPWPNVSWSVIDYNYKIKLAYKMLKKCYAPVLPLVKNWRKSKTDKSNVIGDIIVHNATQTPFTGQVVYTISNKNTESAESNKNNYNFKSKPISFTVSPNRPIKLKSIEVPSAQGTIIRMRLLDVNQNQIINNFSFPAMEPPVSKMTHYRDYIDAKFDGWWRTHMTKLMDLDKIKEELPVWAKCKEENRINPPNRE
jgi:beta-mannosidase